MEKSSVGLKDIYQAADRILGHVTGTPLATCPDLNAALGFNLMIKLENEQLTGSFKIRGAFNNMMQLSDAERRRGVFAFSSGNHAQAVACAAAHFDIEATILMPSNAPQIKIEKTRGFGADVILYDRAMYDPETLGLQIAGDRGLRMIHPYDDLRTIAGQGTIGLEIHKECQNRQVSPDVIIVPCSGGGLASGIALTRDLYPVPPLIYTAEPQTHDDARRSLETASLVANKQDSSSICDALRAAKLGSLTFPILKQQGVAGLAVSEAEAEAAMSVAHDVFKADLEPSGAVALAASLQKREMLQGKNVVVVASGGNVDRDTFRGHLERGRHYARQNWPFAL